uniref:Contactin associated protein like 3 n=1 Tax=Electrophorus electricus TaxID=8005 RepID=A0A4W4FMW8_ELEEL
MTMCFADICQPLFSEACDSPLVSNLPQSAFRSSSQLSNSHGPGYAKLNRRDGAGGWSPLVSNKYQWLEIDLGERTEVTAVATQGRYGSSDWVNGYFLMFSDTGHNWRQYRQEDSIGAFSGNTNADSVVMHKFQQPVFTQFLRVLPLDWNPNGRVGLRLEAYGCRYKSDVVSFEGTSYLLFRTTGPSTRNLLSMNFKSRHNTGILMHVEGQHGQTLTLELLKGKLFLHLRKGTLQWRGTSGDFHTTASSGSLLDDQHWHRVTMEHLRGRVNFTVDKTTMLFFHKISFGGVPAVGSEHSRRNFHGCLENVLYNDVNVIEMARDQQLSIMGNVTFSCPETVAMPVTFASPESFLRLPWEAARDGLAVSLQLRTWNKVGLLVTFDLRHQAGTLWLYLSEAKLRLQIIKAGRVTADMAAGQSFSRVLVCNDGGCRNPFGVFQGCMRLIHRDNTLVDLIKVQQMVIGNFSDLQMDMCGIIDRCSPSHCEHGGKCTQAWSTFHCNCSSTGYAGATCHSSIYEPSCEAYKHQGNTSGFYHIDVDGSGPIKPQLIYCNMSGKCCTTHHRGRHSMNLKFSNTQHLAHFNYSADTEQLGALITQAEYCEQELSYHCKKSRLLNTPDGAPFTWWVGRLGEAHTYWGGALPSSQQCACGLQDDCAEPARFCNCDSDLDAWANDSGVLSHKDHLPVRLLAVGDINRPGSEAAYRVGPLQCYGDKDFWNAAYFNKETSYLHFPTFHGELSADISFFFKTSSSSGVFLENLGIKDFIRIELSSPTEIVFSFDVGNGPFEVRVETPMDLNDERWHHVRAERNVKEASLHVDHLPGARQKAPADGHIHLQLNSQLFVGGTASRQKGFLGCIRTLKLNGNTLDLEERANITPGVRPGCPGHCNTYGGLCQNQGHCVERHNGFTCDCSVSAYTGTFCHKEVSAYFRPGTSVTYVFRELSGNASTQSSYLYSDLSLRGENVSLSFSTSQTPALLLYVSSYHREYLAVFLNRNGQLDVKYKLQSNKEAEVFRSNTRNLANGQLHRVSIRRHAESLSVQVRQILPSCQMSDKSSELDPEIARLNSLGFTGCLSVVQFNAVAPLKAALLYPHTSTVTVSGTLTESNCGSSSSSSPYAAETTHSLLGKADPFGTVGTGEPVVNAISSDSALIGGVIAVVIFVILAALAIMARFLYRRKETCPTQEPKGVKSEDSPETLFSNDPNSQGVINDNQKEYFI